ncbi:carbohydrate-binding protein [Chitinophaga arvensicola]|uniref:Por secretion system C-terminal sorting domain-containing protein n=1 Tax=Chitinophaga arvensicola TaxID=29529 RepID=A0A1I0SCE1_9BACT|nr:carbohydrate-binding protein [Chitinophaga arvensicola]SEW53470.1 Por secretion system C-terminal sorting domain-containing protein [Chitinophaga arvensicola]
MKKISTLLVVWCMLLCSQLHAQYLLLDDMEGHGPASGKWTYYAGNTTTGKVQFGVPNPNPSGLNTSTLVAKFTKDTSCFEYMSASCSLKDSFNLSSNSTFKMLIYSNVQEEIMFKIQPGTNYSKAVFFTYKPTRVNQWEEATFNFQSVKNRTDFNTIAIQFIDGKKANGILYFDFVQAPNPTNITLKDTTIRMGSENGAILTAKVNGGAWRSTLTASNWVTSNLPPGVTIGSVQRVNDSIARITLSGNSAANYSRTTLRLSVAGTELDSANVAAYTAKGNVTFEGNPNWTLVFADEFNTNGIPDASKWTVDPRPKGWINGEQQVYTDTTHDNARIRDGRLVLTGKKDFPTGNTTEPWSSARLITQGKFDFLYGKVEVRAKLPRARGSWPAIWLMPTTSAYGGWPKSGELDVMEHVGNNFGTVLSTIHTQNRNWTNVGGISNTKKLMDADTTYHVYSMEWEPDTIRFFYDTSRILTYANPHTDWKDWPFDQKFHLILNLAIGGGMGGSIAEADWPDSMVVDYARIYQKGLGTPVLDNIVVTPADLSFLAGKQQQYTAKAFDQNGYPIAITPVWSITGAGNTITATGLATLNSSGKVTATATVDTTTKTGAANVNGRPANYKNVPVKIQAENFDNSNACCTEATADIGGGLDVSYIGAGTWFEYDLNVPRADTYRIQFRVAVNSIASLKIQLDSTLLQTVNLPASGGWQKWITVTSAPIRLEQGQQTIKIVSNKDGWNFNWLSIFRADSITLSRILVKPDSVTLNMGQTQQFTATGQGQDSSTFVITPVWTVSGPGSSSISANGLFTASATGNYLVQATAGAIRDTAIVRVITPPALTRIVIIPDSITVPLRASQQFVVKGYDQRDSIFIFKPVWSTTASGNTIDTNGVFTADNAPGTYSVTASGGTLSATAVVTTGYTCTVNDKYEAESASNRATGPVLGTTTDVGSGQDFTNLKVNDWFAYSTLNVPVKGRYTISLRVWSTAASTAWIGHSGFNFGTITIPSTGGTWKTVKATITLPALSYTGIHVGSGSFRFNWFSIDNCAIDSSIARMAFGKPEVPVENADTQKLLPYPNPTNGMLTINLNNTSYRLLTLTDIRGNILGQWIIPKGEKQLSKDISSLAGGTYILKLEGGNKTKTFKIVKL